VLELGSGFRAKARVKVNIRDMQILTSNYVYVIQQSEMAVDKMQLEKAFKYYHSNAFLGRIVFIA